MVRNEDGTYTYFIIPNKYKCVYKKLLIRMSDIGLDILRDCNAVCGKDNRQLINCWNMFQSACSSYRLGLGKQADMMINYINSSLNFGCTDMAIEDVPYIIDFELNIPETIIGAKPVIYNTATLVVGNKEFAQPESLTIYKVVNGVETIVASGLPIISPVHFNDITFNAAIGELYTWRASVIGKDNKVYYSADFLVSCVAVPKLNIMYYGHTDITPQIFETMTVDQIMALDGNTPRAINNDVNNNFIIHQEKTIHYLLIPEDKIELVRAEYGTALISVLWDGTGNNAAYRTNNPGGSYGGIRYKVFFLYTPIVFTDDIRITAKNK